MNMFPPALLNPIATTPDSLMSKPCLTLICSTNNHNRWYEEKLERSRRKLAAGYERERFIKQQHTSCILQPHQLPSPLPPPAAAYNHRQISRKQQQQQHQHQQKKKKKLNVARFSNKPARSTSLLAKWRSEEKVFRKLHRLADRPKSSSTKINTEKNQRTTETVQTATQRRRELILQNILGHTPTIPAPAPVATFPGKSSSNDLQHMSSSDHIGQTNIMELQKKDSHISDLKCSSQLQIIRKSMFKFIIKLGRSGVAGEQQTACH